MPKSFLEDYLEYAANDEAPYMFHVWCGFGALSSAIGRRVWLCHGENAIYGNIYLLLVGEAGGGKSTALSKVRRMIAELGNVPCTASVETVEGLIRVIAGESGKNAKASECYLPLKWPDGVTRGTHNMIITANEFVDMIRSSKEVWTGFLCNIYDENFYHYRTKGMGEDKIEGPYICLLGAVPTDISKDLQAASIITSGLARRTLFQYGVRKYHEPKPWPKFDQVEKDARARCVERLRAIQKMAGEMTLSPASRTWWESWYCEHSRTTPERATPTTQGWLSSKPNQVQKLAMLACLSDSDLMVIEPHHFELAVAYLAELEKDLHHVFGGVGRNDIARVVGMFESFIHAQPGLVTEELLKRNFFTQFSAHNIDGEFNQVLSQLQRQEKICRGTITVIGPDKLARVVNVVAKSRQLIEDYVQKLTISPPPVSLAPPDSASGSPPSTGPSAPPS